MFRNSDNLQQDLFNDQIAYVESLWSWELFRKKLRPFIIRSIQSFSFEITKEKKYYFRNDIVLHCYLSKRMNKSVLRYKINQIPETFEMLLEILIVSWNWKKRGGGYVVNTRFSYDTKREKQLWHCVGVYEAFAAVIHT